MKSSGIGGQAVLEGVMMRNRDKYAVAVRKPDGEISVQNWDTGSVRDRHILLRLPIVRGVVAFIESLILGIKTLTYSSSFLEEDGEKAGQVEAVEISDRKELLENILIVALSILLAVGFFMILPFVVSELFRGKVHSQTTISVIEGVLKVLLFLGYVVAISFLSDIKRTFMYHGAEHKTINCVENGLDLTVENVKKQSRYHRRCGTSFLLVVMIVSIVFFMFIRFDNLWIRMLYRILLIPVVAGVSFELIQFVGNTDNKLVLLISKPGLWLQKLTTREPDDGMIEVAIASVEAVFDWRAYQTELHKEKERRARRKKKAEKRKQETAEKKEETAFVNENDETSDETGIVAAKPEEADETVWSRSGAVTKKQKKADGEKEAVTRESEQTEAVPEQEESTELEKAARKKEKESAELEKAARKKEKESAESEKAARENKKESAELEKAARKKKKESSKATKEKESNSGFWKKLPKSKKRRELEEREERYRNRAAERMRQIKEQEAREAAHEKAYQEAKKRRAERLAATQELPKLDEGRKAAPKVTVEQDADDLKSLDRFFDDKKK